MRNLFDPSRSTVHVAVSLSTAGFVLIVLAWRGAASLDFTQGQIPYLISGGVGGLGLVLVGLTLAVVHELRRATVAVLTTLEQLADRDAARAGPTVVPGSGGTLVVAGRSTYHRASCRLVRERTDLQTMAPPDASALGLAPCRICDASAADVG